MFKLRPPRPGDKKLYITCPSVREGGCHLEIDYDDVDKNATLMMATAIARCLKRHFLSSGLGQKMSTTRTVVTGLGTDLLVGGELEKKVNWSVDALESQGCEVLSVNIHVAKGWTWLTILYKGIP